MPDAVLITRPEPGASETAARIAAMGLTPLVAPLLEVRPAFPPLPRPGQVAAILLASGHAAGPLPAAFHDHMVLTVGNATARRARAAGFIAVTSADRDAASLTSLVRATVPARAGTLLLAAGQGQSLGLAAGLRGAGYRVTRRVVYEAVPAGALPAAARLALLAENTRTVLFFSAETARLFMRLVRASGLTAMLAGRRAITIGASAGMALEGAGWACVQVAREPNQDEMLALLR